MDYKNVHFLWTIEFITLKKDCRNFNISVPGASDELTTNQVDVDIELHTVNYSSKVTFSYR